MENLTETIERRDQLGRLHRMYPDGREFLVCDWSGREHVHYLIPWAVPNRESRSVEYIWVDKTTWREWTHEMRGHFNGLGPAILDFLFRRFFGRP